MKEFMNKTSFNHHFYPMFLLTPLATAVFRLENNLEIKCIYIFGIRVARLTQS